MPIDLSNSLLVYDLFHAKILIYALTVMAGVLPGLTTLLLFYFMVQSTILCFLTDHQYAKLGVRIFLGIIIANVALGGLLSNIISGDASVISQNVNKIVSYRNLGVGSLPLEMDAYGSTPFETYAYAGLSDVAFATSAGENLAAAVPIKKTKIEAWSLTVHDAATREDIKFRATWAALYNRLDEKPMLSSLFYYVANSVTTLSFSASKLAEVHNISEQIDALQAAYPAKQEVIPDYPDDPSDGGGLTKLSPRYHEFRSLYAAVGDPVPSEIIAPSMSFYPGGPVNYGKYMWNRANNPNLSAVSKFVDAIEVVNATTDGRRVNSFGPKAKPATTGSFRNLAATTGDYDTADTGVLSEYYLRTHTKMYSDACVTGPSANANLTTDKADVGGTSLLKLLDPCQLSVPAEIAAATGLTGPLSAGGMLDDLLSDAFGSLTSAVGGGSTMSSVQSLIDMSDWDIDISTPTACGLSSSLSDIVTHYEDKLADPDSMSAAEKLNQPCMETAMNLAKLSSITTEAAKNNSNTFSDYLLADIPFALESGAVLAVAVNDHDDDDNDGSGPSGGVFALNNTATTGNNADLGNALRQLLSVFADDYTNVPNAIALVHPTAIEGTDVQETLGNNTTDPTAGAPANLSAKPTSSGVVGTLKKWGTGLLAGGAAIAAVVSGVMPWSLIMRAIGVLMSCVPMIAIAMAFTMLYYTVLFTTALGLATLPIWALFALGKTFTGASGGDESYGGMSLFPFLTMLGVPFILGAEMAGLGIASGQVMSFFQNLSGFIAHMAAGVGGMLSNGVVGAFGGGAVFSPLTHFQEALRPIGIMAGVGMLPGLILKLSRGSSYEPKLSEGASNRVESMAPNFGSAALLVGNKGKATPAQGSNSSTDGAATTLAAAAKNAEKTNSA